MRRELTSVIWSGLGKVGTKGVAFVFSVFLARMLTPEDFGLCGMIALFIALASMFAECGFSAAIVRKNNLTDRDYATVFWSQLASAVVCCAALCLFAPAIAAFLGRSELVGITRLVSVNVVWGALASVPYTRLRLTSRFRAISVVDVVTSVLSGAFGLALAAKGRGVWAIVWQGFAWNALRTLLLFAAARWLPSRTFSRDSFREFFAFGWKQLAASLVNTTYSNLQALLIGRWFGAAETGLYNRAHYYIHEPGSLMQGIFTEVGYPALAEVQGDAPRMKRRFLRFAGAEALVMSVGLGVFALFAGEIVEFLVGARWLACVPYIRILALGAAVEPLRQFMLLPFYVKGRTDLVLKLELVEIATAVILLFGALPYGILAICWSKTAYHVGSFALTGVVLWKRFR